MLVFNKKDVKNIINKYLQGFTLKEIGELYNVSRTPIKKILMENCEEYTGKKRKSTDFIRPNTYKICPKCNKNQPLENFSRGNGMYGRRSICKTCESVIQRKPENVLRRRLQEKKRRENPEYVKMRNKKDKERRLLFPKHWLWASAKNRAKKHNIEFTITEDDFDLPKRCPLLNIPLWKNPEKPCSNSYSLDRINPKLGYVKGNVWVISKRANAIKNDATVEELSLLVKNLKKKVKDCWKH